MKTTLAEKVLDEKITQERNKNWKEKTLHGEYIIQTEEVMDENSWRWLKKWTTEERNRRPDNCYTRSSFTNKCYLAQH